MTCRTSRNVWSVDTDSDFAGRIRVCADAGALHRSARARTDGSIQFDLDVLLHSPPFWATDGIRQPLASEDACPSTSIAQVHRPSLPTHDRCTPAAFTPPQIRRPSHAAFPCAGAITTCRQRALLAVAAAAPGGTTHRRIALHGNGSPRARISRPRNPNATSPRASRREACASARRSSRLCAAGRVWPCHSVHPRRRRGAWYLCSAGFGRREQHSGGFVLGSWLCILARAFQLRYGHRSCQNRQVGARDCPADHPVTMHRPESNCTSSYCSPPASRADVPAVILTPHKVPVFLPRQPTTRLRCNRGRAASPATLFLAAYGGLHASASSGASTDSTARALRSHLLAPPQCHARSLGRVRTASGPLVPCTLVRTGCERAWTGACSLPIHDPCVPRFAAARLGRGAVQGRDATRCVRGS
ncbi:uncharacterized protein B0H18DRAFT_523234 [Fomitopsis serialis]|uniref:uncharacterized protein n=1 Tax=Fomitopsis serialis TaxID=139415 RepID=UPI002008A7CC|nr:uncharacterized protein B0H18DRAFT_523234 [Neoantrodia serialis]KAH9922226.1 hypothetical protein B0H18DRAFT_523234 [Neoantrodia serialis]